LGKELPSGRKTYREILLGEASALDTTQVLRGLGEASAIKVLLFSLTRRGGL
jgi:hypothetical protein